MAARIHKIRTATLILLGCAVGVPVRAQEGTETSPVIQSAGQPTTTSKDAPSNPSSPPGAVPAQPTEGSGQAGDSGERPLPDITAMMYDVETKQRKAEAVEKDYLYHSVETELELDGHGQIKKTTVTESDHYWLSGVPVRRVVKKNGKLLSPEEIAKENERIDKLAAKARERREKADAEGKETDPRGDEEITVSRLLELGAFTNARRVPLNSRDTIAVDYAGDPQAKSQNHAEDAIRDLRGTAWVDERDHMLVRVEGHFVNAFKVGGGLVVNIQKDTHFTMEQTKVNGEVWLPAHIEAQGAARALLFFNFNGSVRFDDSGYRKFRATSTILPGLTRIDTASAPDGSVQP